MTRKAEFLMEENMNMEFDSYESALALDSALAEITGQTVSTIKNNRDRYYSYEGDRFVNDPYIRVYGR